MSTKKKEVRLKPDTDFNTGVSQKLDVNGLVSQDSLFERRLSKRRAQASRLKRRIFKHVFLVRVVLVLIVLILLGGGLFFGFQALRKGPVGRWVFLARSFIFPPAGVAPTINGRTNILILGKSGVGQDSPDITDTMIVASISEPDRKISFVSIPRDIWVSSMRAKINSAYYYGKQKGGGSMLAGIVLAKSAVEEIVGIPIQYAVVIDFSGFEKIIDEIGGIDVVVDKSFVDRKYPVAGREADQCGGDPTFACRYQTVQFEQGLQHMDGVTALKFVRSRHAEGDEGSDLARALRQQKVMKAVIAKMLTPSVFLSFQKDSALLAIINSSLETDISTERAPIIARWIVDSRDNVVTHSVPEEFLYNPPASRLYDYQFVFVPKKGNWLDLQAWVKETLP